MPDMSEETSINLHHRVHVRAYARIGVIHREINSGVYPDNARLAGLLEVTERTVKRDVRMMRDRMNAPIKYDRKEQGYYYGQLGWQPAPVQISEGELLALFTADHALRHLGHTPEAALLRNALTKLTQYLPEQIQFNLTTLGDALTYQETAHTSVEPTTLRTLARAAAEQRTIECEYYSQHRGKDTQRAIDVLLLHNFAGDWYAIAYDHLRGEVRDFHAGRMRNLRETARYFAPPDNWNADNYLRRGFYMMRGGRLTTVSIVFDAYQAQWIRERHTFHPDEQREDLEGGELRLSFPVGSNGLEAVARFCMAYAGHCYAERPHALRKIIRQKLQLALQQHAED